MDPVPASSWGHRLQAHGGAHALEGQASGLRSGRQPSSPNIARARVLWDRRAPMAWGPRWTVPAWSLGRGWLRWRSSPPPTTRSLDHRFSPSSLGSQSWIHPSCQCLAPWLAVSQPEARPHPWTPAPSVLAPAGVPGAREFPSKLRFHLGLPLAGPSQASAVCPLGDGLRSPPSRPL